MTEKEQVEFFFKNYSETEIENLNQLQNDPPDFDFNLDDKLISLEHTRYFKEKGELIRARKTLESKIIEKTKNFYEKQSDEKISVTFNFDKNIILKQNQIEDYCKQLCEIIIENTPEQFNDSKPLNLYEHLPRFIKRIVIINYSFDYSFWQPSSAYKTGDISFKKLRERIESKSKDIPRYENEYFEKWLLIVVERSEYSDYATFDALEFKQNHLNKNLFDKIYLLALRHRPECVRIL